MCKNLREVSTKISVERALQSAGAASAKVLRWYVTDMLRERLADWKAGAVGDGGSDRWQGWSKSAGALFSIVRTPALTLSES